MVDTKYCSLSAERALSKAVRKQLNIFPLHLQAGFFLSNLSPGYKLGGNGYRGMAHTAFSQIMCHMKPINTQPKPVQC